MARTSAFAQQITVLKRDLHRSVAETMAATARKAFAEAQAINRAELGHEPDFEQIVDGIRRAPLESVRPGGKIVFLFAVGAELLTKAVDDAIAAFLRLAPVGRGKDPHPGLYRDSLALLVNGTRRDPDAERGAIEFKESDVVGLTNLQPYARRIELGWSSRAPDGVFEVVHAVAKRRYGGVLNITFAYEHFPGFAVGRTRKGGRPTTAKDVRRVSSYPTVTFSVK